MTVPRRLTLIALLLTSTFTFAQGTFPTTTTNAPVRPSYTTPPYVATRKDTSIQKLADGTTITRTFTVKEARSSDGVTITQRRCLTPDGNRGWDWTYTSIHDPITGITTMWNDHTKQATVYRPSTAAPSNTANSAIVNQPDPALRPQPKHESLGGKTILGVYAEGVRNITTYPAGSIGNDKPIVVTSEHWTAPDLKMYLYSAYDDPRSASSTSEVTELDRSEPTPSLFQIPEGYTTKDILVQP